MKIQPLCIWVMVISLSVSSSPLYAENPDCSLKPFQEVLTALQSKTGFFFKRWSKKNIEDLSRLYELVQDETQFGKEVEKLYRSRNKMLRYRSLKYLLGSTAVGTLLYGFVRIQADFQASPLRDLILILATVFTYSMVEAGLAPPLEMLSALLKQNSYHLV